MRTLFSGIITFKEELLEQEIGGKNRLNLGKKIKECKVEVYNGEGQIPHMHVYSTNGNFSTCVCIYSPHYFSHGGKYTGKFNSSQCKQFNDWIQDHWKNIVRIWEDSNPNCKFPESRKTKIQPNYTYMENFKDN